MSEEYGLGLEIENHHYFGAGSELLKAGAVSCQELFGLDFSIRIH